MADIIDAFMGNHIREMRIKMGVERADLAEELGINDTQLEKYEDGIETFKASTIFAIAEFMGMTVSNLLPSELPNRTWMRMLH